MTPFATGHLGRPGGQTVYWEASGDPAGRPAIWLHGGPGGGLGAGGYRRSFGPAFMVVGLDQRGCGRSAPLAGTPGHDLAANTTQALIADIEALREHLGIARWLVAGGSWGSTLALAYAQAHPERVTAIALAAVTTTTRFEVDWITVQMRRTFPREWDLFAAGVPAGERPVDAYARRLADPDPAVRAAAADAWCAWEDAHMGLTGRPGALAAADAGFRAVFATLVTHYWRHAAFLPEGALRAGVGRIAHLPGVLIHGRRDVSSPLEIAWDLHRAWPGSELVVTDDGHSGPGMGAALADALGRL